MAAETIAGALRRLREAADRCFAGFPNTTFQPVPGPGEAVVLNGHGGFAGLQLAPGSVTRLRAQLDLPEDVDGVRLAGDTLEATLFSLFPCTIHVNNQVVFDDGGVPVAAGPALIRLLEALKPGPSDTLDIEIRTPPNQITPWFQMRLTTPGLRARFEALDIAWSQLALAEAFAENAAQWALVEHAASSLPDPLPTEPAALAKALSELAGTLAPLDEAIKRMTVLLIGHSHIDMNWLWTWPDTVEVIRRDFKSVLALMEEFPELTFSHSQAATYEVIRQQEPALFQQVLQRIREGRWEPLSTTWVEGDVNMASGEGHARQLLEGVHYTRETLHSASCIYHAPDTFGHAGNLPQLARQAGALAYYHHRANPGKEDQWPAYWWEGQDGSRILGISTHSYNGEIHARDLATYAIRARRWGHPVCIHFHGIGDHGGGPSRQNLEALRRFQQTSLLPTARCGTLREYVGALLAAGCRLPEVKGESSTIFEGCYTTHADTKRYNRHGENLLTTADTLAAMAGLDFRAELQEAWRAVCFNQFHDILDGSAIHEAYEKNREDFEEARAAAERVTDAALHRLHAGTAPDEVVVTNPLGFARADWVQLESLQGEGSVTLLGDDGSQAIGQYGPDGLGFVAAVPAFGTVRYRIVPAAYPAIPCVPSFAPTDAREANLLSEVRAEAPYLRIDTDLYRCYVRRDCGILVSFVDKRSGRELVGFGMRRASDYIDTARPDLALNVLQIRDELPHGMSSWQLHEVYRVENLLKGASTRLVEQGPARIVLEVEHSVRSSRITQRIVFYRDLDRVDFDTFVDWREIGNGEVGVPGLAAAFTARLPECQAWFETPFAAARRPADGQEVPALRWAAVGGPDGGIALLNDCKYGHSAKGCQLAITLIRSGYDPDAISDVGEHRFRYAFLPYVGEWCQAGVVRKAASFNQPLLATLGCAGEPAEGVFRPRVEGACSVLPSILKRARDGSGTIVRLYESSGRTSAARIAGLPASAAVWECSIVEDRLRRLPAEAGSAVLTFGPWEVKTLLVEH